MVASNAFRIFASTLKSQFLNSHGFLKTVKKNTDFKGTNNRNICGCCISGGTGCDQNAAFSLCLFNGDVELNNSSL